MKYVLIGVGALLALGGAVTVPWLVAPAAMLQVVQLKGIEKALGEAKFEPGPRGDFAVYEGGEGPTMVLVHGFGDSASGWSQVAPLLTDSHRLLVPDLPGSGLSSPGPDEDLAYNDLERGLEQLLVDEEGPITLVGNSLGGMLVARYALSHPDDDLHVVLLNGAIVHRDIPNAELVPSTREELAVKNERLFGEGNLPPLPGFMKDGLLEMQDQHRYRALLADINGQNLWLGEQAKDLGHPTTTIWGTPDGFFPVEDTAVFSDAPVLLEGCGHSPQYTCPERLAEALLAAR